MTNVELMTLIGQIPDTYILEAKNGESRRNRMRLNRGMLAALIVALVLMLVGCAVGYILQYPFMLETILGTNGREQYESDLVYSMFEPQGRRTSLNDELARKYIDPYIFPVESSLSDGNSTLTAISCIVDRTSCTAAVYLKLENPPVYTVYNSGWLLFLSDLTEDIWYFHPVAIGQENIIGRCFLDEASTTDETLYYVFIFSCEPGCTSLELRIRDSSEKIVIPLPDKTDMPSISMDEGRIQITPFGMRVSTSVLQQDDVPQQPARNRREIAIRLKDGSEYLIRSTGFEDKAEDYTGYTYGMALDFSLEEYVCVFSRVVDIQEVAGFRINDHFFTP